MTAEPQVRVDRDGPLGPHFDELAKVGHLQPDGSLLVPLEVAQPLLSSTGRCGNCGAPTRIGAGFCHKCGSQRAASRGLGDTIAKITKAVGIKPCEKCKKRQAMLNKLVPYRSANLIEHPTGGEDQKPNQ